ncbi:RHS repeat-associated core domain-containing protein [Lysobacter koreensis]|uniref:RHS repeat-associated core domain-containing protein n=1 Tax=Lysobacter koreensis TaxID=266122 RepID=A0ABW2YK76_9GAMM
MTIAAKHFDPQLGIDIHLTVVPPLPVPIPLPTPHIGIVLDPFDYLPFIGNEVHVNGVKSATAGTGGLDIHIPLGAWLPTLKMPAGPQFEDELFMGSMTVLNSGEPFSRVAMPVLDCNFIGMIPPFRLRKPKKPKLSLSLPTAINIAIPASVFIGGPPTISLQAMAFKAAFKLAGKAFRRGGAAFQKLRRKMFANLPSGFLKCKVLRAEPVDIRDGSVSVTHEDFAIPGRLPLAWTRIYHSNDGHAGACGHGWQTPADLRLQLETDGSAMFVDCGSVAWFPRLPAGEGSEHAVLELVDGARLTRDGAALWVQTKAGLRYAFGGHVHQVDTVGTRHLQIERIEDLCGNHWRFERRDGHLVRIVESGINDAKSGQPLQGRFIELQSRHGRIDRIDLHDPATGLSHLLATYEYSADGDLLAAFDPLGAPRSFEYQDHHLLRHTDRVGMSFYYGYNRHWQVVHAWGDGGLYDYTFRYDRLLNETEVTDSLGHVSIVKFDQDGLPLCEIDPLDGATIFEYDDVGRTTALIDPMGLRTQMAYDARGNLLKLTRPDGSTLTSQYDDNDRLVAIIDPAGATWSQHTDERGLLRRQTDPLGANSSYEYDTNGQLRSHTNARGAITGLHFDRYGQLAGIVDPLGHASRFEHDALGRLCRQTDPLGRVTRYHHDAKGRLLSIDSPGGASVACEYDAEDQLLRYQDEAGTQTRLTYVGIGQVGKRIQADGHSVEYHYDTEENLVGLTNQRGEKYLLRRDALGRIVEEIDYWGQTRHYQYDAASRLVATIDPLGQRIGFDTDKLGRIIRKTLADVDQPGQPLHETFCYDKRGQLVELRNPHRLVKRRFDVAGQLLEELQDGFRIAHRYDEVGNRIARETSAGNRLVCGFDLRDQAVSIAINDEAPITLQRDALGRTVGEQLSARVERQFAYDARNLLSAQSVLRDAAPLFETRYDYDQAGNLARRSDSQHGEDSYQYDLMGRLLQHTEPKGRIARYLHDPAGDRLHTRIQQVQMRRAVGGDSESDVLWTREGSFEGVHYVFDRAGDLVRRGGQGGADDPDALQLRWDANHRLADSRRNGQVTTYGYDPLGRRAFKRNPTHTTRFFWDGDALLGEVEQANDDPDGTAIWNGNIANLGEARKRQEQLDALHQRAREYVYYPGSFVPLALIEKCTGVAHDTDFESPNHPRQHASKATPPAHGARQRAPEDRRSNSLSSLRPLLSRDAPVIKAKRVVASAQGVGGLGGLGSPHLGPSEESADHAETPPRVIPEAGVTAATTDAATKPLGFGIALGRTPLRDTVPSPIADVTTSSGVEPEQPTPESEATGFTAIYHYHVDPNGCPTKITDPCGAVVWSASYTAWGAMRELSVERVDNPLRYQGQYFDPESGLHYNRYRYYDPLSEQFIGQDPLGLEAGENVYRFAPNTLGWIDPLGLDELYALVASRDGWYPVMQYGQRTPIGYMHLRRGELWKIGETKTPKTRYSGAWLRRNSLDYRTVFEGTTKQVNHALERMKISGYLAWKGFLPPGNKCRH